MVSHILHEDFQAPIKGEIGNPDKSNSPCQLVRKTFGEEAAEALRYTAIAIFGEENYVEMTPNRSNNYKYFSPFWARDRPPGPQTQ